MAESPTQAYERLLEEIRSEFPHFRIIPKSKSWHQRAIHRFLVVLSAGQMTAYLSGYQTTLGQRVYVTPCWESRPEIDRYLIMRHERVHMQQFRRFTWPGMALIYVLLPLPMVFAYGRAYMEMEAYAESIRATAEVYGKSRVLEDSFRDNILRQFTGASYAWMWPFRGYLRRWYDKQLDCL